MSDARLRRVQKEIKGMCTIALSIWQATHDMQ